MWVISLIRLLSFLSKSVHYPPNLFLPWNVFFKKPGGLFSAIPHSLKFRYLHIHDFMFLSTPLFINW